MQWSFLFHLFYMYSSFLFQRHSPTAKMPLNVSTPSMCPSPMSETSSIESTCSVYSYVEKGPPEPIIVRDMSRQANQQRLYIINRAGTGEAQYMCLNQKRTDIESYSVRLENWRVIKGISNFGVAVVNNVLFVIGGYEMKNCKHLHRVVK